MDALTVKYLGKFVGPDEIVGVSVTDQTTPMGAVVFEVTLKSGRVRLMTEKSMTILVTDEAKDFNFLRDRREYVLVPEIVKLIQEYDVPIQEVAHLVQMIAYEVDNHFGRAANWLWKKDDSQYTPGGDAMHEVTLLMAERVIRDIPKDEPTNTEGD